MCNGRFHVRASLSMISYSSSSRSSINDGHVRRWVHSHTQQEQHQQQQHEQFVTRVRPTNSQKRRNGKIATYGKEKEWQKILDTFHGERKDYELQNLAVTLSQLAKISTFPRDHPMLREILRATADRIDEAVIDTRGYSNICHSIAKLQARRDASAERIINHLGSLKFAKDFWDSGNAQDMAEFGAIASSGSHENITIGHG
jgi:hypothetical protein